MVYFITSLHKIREGKMSKIVSWPTRQKLPFKGQFIKSRLSRCCTARWSGTMFFRVSPTNVEAGKSFLE